MMYHLGLIERYITLRVSADRATNKREALIVASAIQIERALSGL
jgi:hypothetical protein